MAFMQGHRSTRFTLNALRKAQKWLWAESKAREMFEMTLAMQICSARLRKCLQDCCGIKSKKIIKAHASK
jgi:hypothetical protein